MARGWTQISTDAPRQLDSHLIDQERIVFATRRHWARVAEPVASAVLGLFLAIFISARVGPDVGGLVNVLWLAWLFLLARAAWNLWEWSRDWFVATDKRMMLTFGIIEVKVAMLPLARVTDMSYNRSLMGQLLGYGEFIVESAGQDQAMRDITFLPNSRELYRMVCDELFDPVTPPKSDGTEDPDDDSPHGYHPTISLFEDEKPRAVGDARPRER